MSCAVSDSQGLNYEASETPIAHDNSPSCSNSSTEGLIAEANSSTSPKIPFSFGKCKICNDRATGIHYGIATCEGCKV